MKLFGPQEPPKGWSQAGGIASDETRVKLQEQRLLGGRDTHNGVISLMLKDKLEESEGNTHMHRDVF